MRAMDLIRCALLVAACATAALATAADAVVTGIARTVDSLVQPDEEMGATHGDWRDLEAIAGTRWRELPPDMLDQPTPDGDYFLRAGQAQIGGRTMTLVATGARTMVMNAYFIFPGATIPFDDWVAGFREAGYTVTAVRCPMPSAKQAPKRWYRIERAGKRRAWLSVDQSEIAKTRQQVGLHMASDEPPPMTLAESRVYIDDCSGSPPPANHVANGIDGMAALVRKAMELAAGSRSIPWARLRELPAVEWQGDLPTPPSPGLQGWQGEKHSRVGTFRTPTTEMRTTAIGDQAGATELQLALGTNLGGNDVLEALLRSGYGVAVIRCGMRSQWNDEHLFRVSGKGVPAIVLSRIIRLEGEFEHSYRLLLDGGLPPLKRGERDVPPGGRCP